MAYMILKVYMYVLCVKKDFVNMHIHCLENNCLFLENYEYVLDTKVLKMKGPI